MRKGQAKAAKCEISLFRTQEQLWLHYIWESILLSRTRARPLVAALNWAPTMYVNYIWLPTVDSETKQLKWTSQNLLGVIATIHTQQWSSFYQKPKKWGSPGAFVVKFSFHPGAHLFVQQTLREQICFTYWPIHIRTVNSELFQPCKKCCTWQVSHIWQLPFHIE